MAVFLAASDETSGANAFGLYHYAAWVAPEPDWSLYFTPAWQQRVLDGPPQIPYLHMTEMRSKSWRAKWRITDLDMDDRLDEAAVVIQTLGSLYPFKLTIDASTFRPLYRPHKVVVASGAHKDFQPDFLAFMSYAYAVLFYVNKKHPDAEKVDFLVENNSEITKHIYELYKEMPSALTRIGMQHLIPLVGEFIPGGKDRAPLQAADYLCWHIQRAEANNLDDRDARRWNTMAVRKGFNLPMPMGVITGLAEAFAKHGEENEERNRIRDVRQNHAQSHERTARGNQKKTRRRKSGKNAKKAEG